MKAKEKIEGFNRFGIVLGLERMTRLMELLGNPQEALKYIHVAGTNGKGSVCRYLYEALEANGYRVGLFTSPYIEVFNERIQFHGEYISDSDLEKITGIVMQAVDQMIEEGCESPTEFEVVTAIMFLYFAMKNADYVILEVGLGGIGDSTNIIKEPLCCIITSISMDHMDRLGDTLEKIAAEKAGIIKENVPVIVNVADEGARKVIARKAYEKNARVYDISQLMPEHTEQTLAGSRNDFTILGTDYSGVEICMPGEHQVKNLGTALTALEMLRQKYIISIERGKLYEGLKSARQIGRLEVLEESPYVILDGAHNEDGARALSETLQKYFDKERVLIVCGILRDKDIDGILGHFTKAAGSFIITEPDNPRKAEADYICERVRALGADAEAAPSREEAFALAMSRKDDYDAVIFAGSLYLIGEIRRMYFHGKK